MRRALTSNTIQDLEALNLQEVVSGGGIAKNVEEACDHCLVVDNDGLGFSRTTDGGGDDLGAETASREVIVRGDLAELSWDSREEFEKAAKESRCDGLLVMSLFSELVKKTKNAVTGRGGDRVLPQRKLEKTVEDDVFELVGEVGVVVVDEGSGEAAVGGDDGVLEEADVEIERFGGNITSGLIGAVVVVVDLLQIELFGFGQVGVGVDLVGFGGHDLSGLFGAVHEKSEIVAEGAGEGFFVGIF